MAKQNRQSFGMILMDNSIVFTSSLEIGQALHMNAGQHAWVSNT